MATRWIRKVGETERLVGTKGELALRAVYVFKTKETMGKLSQNISFIIKVFSTLLFSTFDLNQTCIAIKQVKN